MTTVITIEDLSKKFIIGHQRQDHYAALRDVLAHKLRGIGQRIAHPLSPNREIIDIEEFWALQHINLEIKQGERVGIIGRNGSGKSTLLKILSRITGPTSGRARMRGRVSSLLEVGTGFHPDLTGRENIFLNGAILGMRRREIRNKFDSIVDFSEIEKFLDTPVKRYSSGMYVRLAFAIAANLDPDILIVDEVLAVGDSQFQKKCLDKMREPGNEERTVLFVSHNMGLIEKLCTRVVLLRNGKVDADGDIRHVTEQYTNSNRTQEAIDDDLSVLKRDTRKPPDVLFTACSLLDTKNTPTLSLLYGEPLTVTMEARSLTHYEDLNFVVGINSMTGTRIVTSKSQDADVLYSIDETQTIKVTATFADLVLAPGIYHLFIVLRKGKKVIDTLPDIRQFEVSQVCYENMRPHPGTLGLISVNVRWS